jgi:hypothetical protein
VRCRPTTYGPGMDEMTEQAVGQRTVPCLDALTQR